ncbi:MAG: hypothetical protein ACHP7P_06135 [Terriglobales bacterium]
MAICIVAGTAAAVVWYLFFLRYNRRQGERAVARIQAALAGSGQIVAVRWLGPSIFQIALRLGTSLFQHSELMVRLAPRQNPVRWLRQWWRREPATVTFEADLDIPPGFNLQVGQHRWCGRTSKRFSQDPDRWEFEQVTPLILTSRRSWQREVTGMMNALLSCRDREVMSLGFRRTSPHFSATLKLEGLSPEGRAGSNVFDTLRELAAGASASRL